MNTEDFESVKKCLRTEIETLKQNNRNLENKIEEMKLNLLKMETKNANAALDLIGWVGAASAVWDCISFTTPHC